MDWAFQFLFTATYMLFVFNTGRWDWVSYYLRYILSAGLFISAFFSYRKAKTSPFFKQLDYKRYISLSIIIVLTIVYSINNFSTIKGFFITKKPLELEFPLKTGLIIFHKVAIASTLTIIIHTLHKNMLWILKNLMSLELERKVLFQNNFHDMKYLKTLYIPPVMEK